MTGLAAGTYNVTVTDDNGCTATANATINEPVAVAASIGSVNNVSCNGGSDGSATASGTEVPLPRIIVMRGVMERPPQQQATLVQVLIQ